jgi:predicted glycosyltransferase
MYHRTNTLFPALLDRIGNHPDTHAVVFPRTGAQRESVRSLRLPSVVVPEQAVDAQSLVALADLVVSAGGTMNREAVVLGTPVYTTFAGRLGGVDEQLVRDGRLRRLERAADVRIERKPVSGAPRVRRDPADLVRWALG